MSSLSNLEQNIESAILSYADQFEQGLNYLKDHEFDLTTHYITISIIKRMRAYTQAQRKLKKLINKRYAAPASDFFVETVAFYVKAFLMSKKPSIEVHSERKIKPKRGMIRPDISLWQGDDLVGIIECKTQLGYRRGKWRDQQIERKKELRKLYPNAKVWLVVFSDVNWEGFGDDPLVNKEYFTLSKTHMRALENNHESEYVLNPIENLLKQL